MKNERFPMIDVRTNETVYLTDEEYMAIPEEEVIYYKSYYPTSTSEIDWIPDDYVISEDWWEK